MDFGFLCKNVMSSFINKLKNIVISMLENQNLVSFLSSEARCSPHGFNKKELQIFIKFRTNQVVFKSFYIFSTNFGIHFRIRRTMLSGNQRAEWIFFRVHIFWEGHKFLAKSPHKNDDENMWHWNYFQIPRALSELPAYWQGLTNLFGWIGLAN